MKKITKRSLIRKLDKLVSEIVRSKGSCERCGGITNLQCCHIFSRKYMNTRFLLDNLICMDASCHFWSHANPILFTEFVRKHLGEEKYEVLKESHNQIVKYTLADLETKLEVLQEVK